MCRHLGCHSPRLHRSISELRWRAWTSATASISPSPCLKAQSSAAPLRIHRSVAPSPRLAATEASHHGNEPFRSFCSLGHSLPRVEQLTGAPLRRPVDVRPFHRAAAPRLKPRCARRDARINPILAALEIELWTAVRVKSGKPPPPLLATDDTALPLPRALILHHQIQIRRSGLERRVL